MPSPKTLSARRLAQMIRWLSAANAMLCALPVEQVPVALYSEWINARAQTQMMRDDLLLLAITDVAVEAETPAFVAKLIPACPVSV